jgi:Fe-S cluster assembly ATP-binding protein
MNRPLLLVEGVNYYVGSGKNRTNILHDINLTINEGEFISITGPNGSGKSTLAKIIMGLIKPKSGSIRILPSGKNLARADITEHARSSIAYSFQQPPHFKGLTVRDLLQIAATGHETFLKENEPNYHTLIEAVGLDESYLDREINNTLSGGELKRIEIASIVARNARLTIFDEPEAGIDLWSFDKLTRLFQEIHENNPDHTIIIITHQERIIKQSSRKIIIKDGTIQSDSATKELE